MSAKPDATTAPTPDTFDLQRAKPSISDARMREILGLPCADTPAPQPQTARQPRTLDLSSPSKADVVSVRQPRRARHHSCGNEVG